MTRRPYWALLLLLPLALPVLAADSSGYTPLFTGTDLTGWRYGKELLHRQTETSDKRFFVSGGVLNLASKDKNGQKPDVTLLTVREFSKDFILRLEFKADQEALCHVQVRNQMFPVADFIRRGEQKHLKNFKKDDWNELEITVKMKAYAEGRYLNDADNLEAGFSNGKAWAKVNGRTVDPNHTILQTLASAKINGEPLHHQGWAAHVVSKGQVGIRSGSNKFQFRNISFKELQ